MKYRLKCSIPLAAFALLLSSGAMGQASAAGNSDAGNPQASADQAAAAGATKAHDDTYVIGNDDVLAINVWKETELSKSVPVRSDGKISLPLAGEIFAAGRTPLQLEQDIASKLKNYITSPEVSVIVEKINSKKFNILGQVYKPGSYSLGLPTTIVDAIAMAGGFRDFAKTKEVYVLRAGANGAQTRLQFNYKDFLKGKNTEKNVTLEPHDTIIVP